VKLTKKDFKNGEYIGEIDFTKKYEGSIEIEGSLGWVKFKQLWVSGGIVAERGTGISAGRGISAGWGISAGEGISAGTGISAGEGISAKLTLKVGYRVFAGIAGWIKNPTQEQLQIKCGKFEGGEICYGNLVETGLPEEQDQCASAESACDHRQTTPFCSQCGAKL
jgi:hypothetical protein